MIELPYRRAWAAEVWAQCRRCYALAQVRVS